MLPELAGARRILAVRLDNVGDLVMLGPALRALCEALPDAEVTLLTSRAGAQVAPLLPWVSDVITTRAVWQDVSGAVPLDPDREIAFAWSLRERHFDAAFVFTSFSQSGEVPGYVTYLAGIPVRVGHSALFSGGVFSHPVDPPADAAHQVDRNLALLEAVGIDVAERELELRVPAAQVALAAALLTTNGLTLGSPYVVVAPGASAPARRYDGDRFAAVAGSLASEARLPVVLVGSDREAPEIERIRERAARLADRAPVVNLAGRTPLGVLASVIERASLVVANDSGPMHIADAFGIPMVVPFSGTDLESQWQPRTSPVRLLRRPTTCSPCYRIDCPYNLECLDIPAHEVVAEAIRLLGGDGSRRTLTVPAPLTAPAGHSEPTPVGEPTAPTPA